MGEHESGSTEGLGVLDEVAMHVKMRGKPVNPWRKLEFPKVHTTIEAAGVRKWGGGSVAGDRGCFGQMR